MNIRFLAQSEYFNGIHLKDDIILEKEYETSNFSSIPRVRYYLYYLEENVRKEVMPHSIKFDLFKITDCQFDSDYLYFTEYDDVLDEGNTFNIIKYNITDHTHTRIISLKDNISLYPDKKEIKIYVLDDSNLIIQRAFPKELANGTYQGFFDFSLILFNFTKNKQIVIQDENLLKNGIEFILPYNDTTCIMKTGYSLIKDNRHDILSEEESAIESLILLNIQQFISDLQLEQQNIMVNAIDQSFYNNTISDARVLENYLIYSKYNYDNNDENIIFYNLDTKESYTCINKTSSMNSLINNATVINQTPYMLSKNSSGTQFFNMISNDIDTVYADEYEIRYVNNNTIISTYIEKTFFGKEIEMVAIHKFPVKKVILQERGQFIGAVASNSETTYIFLK